jgi:putative membrane protein
MNEPNRSLRGDDPDVRFTYANERTFLAWNRTALALVTAGLAITQLLPPFDVPGGRRMIGLPLITMGIVTSIVSLWQWRRNDQAMRTGSPLPKSVLPVLLSIVIAISAVIALVLAVVHDE